MAANMYTSVLFPIFGSFPSVLNFGTNSVASRNIEGQKLLFVLDNTGSMGEFINEKHECSKAVMAKRLISNVLEKVPGTSHDVLLFNTSVSPPCQVGEIPPPGDSTYFSPLVPVLKGLVPGSTYCSVVFMSDGLPSEDLSVAREAIKTIGNITREAKANPVSVAVGSDADGESCGQFAGNRGFNCFIKYDKDREQTVADIVQGVKCNYHELENGAFIPVEADGHYYYVGETAGASAETVKATRPLVEKYLNLVFQKYISDSKQVPLLKSLVEHVIVLLDTDVDKSEVQKKYFDILESVKKVVASLPPGAPAMLSAVSTCYRTASNQV